jgi:hypothetical protein
MMLVNVGAGLAPALLFLTIALSRAPARGAPTKLPQHKTKTPLKIYILNGVKITNIDI